MKTEILTKASWGGLHDIILMHNALNLQSNSKPYMQYLYVSNHSIKQILTTIHSDCKRYYYSLSVYDMIKLKLEW